jgi:O-antigen ligase
MSELGAEHRARLFQRVSFCALAPIAVYTFISLPALLVLAGLSTPTFAQLRQNLVGWARSAHGEMALLGLLFLLLSASWSPGGARAAVAGLQLGAMTLLGVCAVGAIRNISSTDGQFLAKAAFAAFAGMAVLYGMEAATNGGLSWVLMHNVSRILPGVTDPALDASLDPSALLTKIGRGAAILVALAWPLAALLLKTRIWWGALFVWAIALVIVLAMPMDAPRLAFVASTVAFCAAFFFPRAATRTATIGAAIIVLAAPVVTVALDRPERLGIESASLDISTQYRVQIYRHVAGTALDRPWFGHGFRASRHMGPDAPRFQPATDELIATPDMTLIPLHTHNIALQVWLEAGFIGAVLLAGLLLAIGRLIAKKENDRETTAAHLAIFTVFFSMALVSHGAWQLHWQAALWLTLAASASISAHGEAVAQAWLGNGRA